MKTLIIIPTYNERENVTVLLDRILNLSDSYEILVIDDHSPDRTADAVREGFQNNPRVHLQVRERKLGLGTAYAAGFRYALRHEYSKAITMDADLSHDPESIPLLEKTSNDFDLVIGSRYISGGKTVGWGLIRMLISRTANLVAHRFLSLKPADCTSGFRIYRSDLLKQLEFESIKADGYSYLVEILHVASRHHAKIGEVPIVFADRRRGRSKISRKEIFKAIFTMLRLRFTHLKPRT